MSEDKSKGTYAWEDAVRLPDGSGAMTASFQLPVDHWITRPGMNVPPMEFRMGVSGWTAEVTIVCPLQRRLYPPEGRAPEVRRRVYNREELSEAFKKAARFAVRGATRNGAEENFDPDALVTNLVVGLLGYYTEDGLSPEDWENPGPKGDTARATMSEENGGDPIFIADSLEYR